jgi:hypothetical protein
MPDKSLGTLGNSLAGVARGGIVGVILQAIAPALQGGEGAGSIIGSIVGGGGRGQSAHGHCFADQEPLRRKDVVIDRACICPSVEVIPTLLDASKTATEMLRG